jgi:8-oxo-dGTP pyrophosphatase MutT (NUDIX family)
VIPYPAATVVLLRDTPTTPEVFMVRRHQALAFMGGAFVFPGGRVDAADGDDADLLRRGSGGQELRFRLAALRELFEEGGVLLARDAGGAYVSLTDPATHDRFIRYRKRVIEDALEFRAMLEHERLHLDVEALVPCAHWITPPRMSKRFDTRFFAARMPPGQLAVHDKGETTESLWIAPADALERGSSLGMDLPPPTLHTLEELVPFRTVAEILAAYTARPVQTHEPR